MVEYVVRLSRPFQRGKGPVVGYFEADSPRMAEEKAKEMVPTATVKRLQLVFVAEEHVRENKPEAGEQESTPR